MFLKSNKSPHTLSPYRSIQLTPTLSKVLEKNVVRRLHNHLRDHNLLPPYQAGFRSKYSINIQLLRLTSLITNHFNKSQPSCKSYCFSHFCVFVCSILFVRARKAILSVYWKRCMLGGKGGRSETKRT